MKVSINGARRNITNLYNDLIKSIRRGNRDEICECSSYLGQHINHLNLIYDDNIDDDFDEIHMGIETLQKGYSGCLK